MKSSKDLFLMMREQEVTAANFLPSKKEIQQSSKKFIDDLIESGEQGKLEMFAQAVRINEALSIVTDTLKKSLPAENFEAYGIKGQYRNGGETLNYSEDWLYAELQEKLKERAELIKVATKTKDPVYDSNGVEVTKVSTTSRKDSLVVSY
jgi:hypothetical protein